MKKLIPKYQQAGSIRLYYANPTISTQDNTRYIRPITDIEVDKSQGLPIGTTTTQRAIRAKQNEPQPTISATELPRETQEEINRAMQAQRVVHPINTGLNALEYTPVLGDAISFGRAVSDLFRGNTATGLAGFGMLALPNVIEKPAKLLSLSGRAFKNTLKSFNSAALPSELERPLFLSHTVSGENLAKILNKGTSKIPSPSIAIVGSKTGNSPATIYNIIPSDGKYTFYFKPEYIDNLEHVAKSRDMFAPTYANAETWTGRTLRPEEVINTKRAILNKYNTLTDLQDFVNFKNHDLFKHPDVYTDLGANMTLEDVLRLEKRIPPTLQNAGHSLRNRQKHTKNVFGYGEVMPLDFVDLNKAPLIIGGGSKNPIILDFLKGKNFYEVGKPVLDNPYNIPGIAFKGGGKF